MKFEVEKKSNKKKIILGISVFILLGTVLIVKNSFAKYSSVKTIHLVNGTVNYTKGDFSIVAMYKNDGSGDTEITTMPNEGYTINQDKSYCTLNGTKDTNAKLYTNSNGGHEIKGLSKGSKCYLYFNKSLGNPLNTLKKLKETSKGRYPNSVEKEDRFTGKATADDTGIYETEDDYGTSYYYRGISTELYNYVSFAGSLWKIIRINGNGSIRIIYNSHIGTTNFNTIYGDNTYVGYMFGTAGSSSISETHANINDSTIKSKIDAWYKTNIEEKGYSKYLDIEAGFCNDRQTSDTGTKQSYSKYASLVRINSGSMSSITSTWKQTQTPTLFCLNKERDLFTVVNAADGNKKLTYPVGLITSDEVVYAGGFGDSSNSANSFYLNNGYSYWTMSPAYFYSGYDGNAKTVELMYVNKNGWFTTASAYADAYIRPVVNLRADVSFKPGTNGSSTNPYVVVE